MPLLSADADTADNIPMTSCIPLLHPETRRYLRRSATQRRHVRAVGPSRHCVVKRLQRLRRRRSSHGLQVIASDNPILRLQDMDEELYVSKNMSALCTCWSCRYLEHWSTSLQPYRCNYKSCMIDFESFTDMYEHQLEVHGSLNPKTNRVVNDTFRQQRGTLAFPPATIYAAQQYMVPSRPPIPLKSINELENEAKVVRNKLYKYNQDCFETPYKLFRTGYQLVKRNGRKEMERQYQIAMEHFYSGMQIPATSRGFHDGCPSIERGRNWLTSTDREQIRSLFPFGVNDKADVEPEFVLIDTKCDQEMQECYIELSDDSDDATVVTRCNAKSKEKKLRATCNVRLKASARGKSKLFKNQSINIDEQDAELDTDKGDYFNKRDAFDFDSDDDATIMSKEYGRDSDSETDSNSELDFSRPADSCDSDSNSENDDGKRLLIETSQKEIVSDSDSESYSDDEVTLNARNVTAFSGSDSETTSDRDSHSETGSDDSHKRSL